MSIGAGVIRGHVITLRRFLLTFWRDIRLGQGLTRRGGGTQLLDFFRGPKRGKEPTIQQDFNTVGLFTRRIPRRAAAGLRAVSRLAGTHL